ncbi:2-dehydro-3-deoxyphosphooctonate aldolase (KDO 8-P synthase) [Geoalkalibacter ferrihydriticus]|uniref:2-dehydro-3-deoxyphosphooctonate aldolase n=2 Tax=Geoalkalibacter ferrihydriticus TaxID=392333 RepID=A0A0C2HUT0_9BACT|nr:3-deoxy-8-phosphooctulonate synthase [Geoalkalibacter ferrihydriticus]KIH76567.1 2-dehydro-3-deoxyphosphooctonate aldolase [Geoalkalibacter ferrihydriticus DSM 17813]SDM01795.1 2-dehydro-3-deoxyphosphooctonate aldolase (KDO 8-P synthase) [Geoalkalibacter ferrihydriticus]
MNVREIHVGNVTFGGGRPLVLIAGPCVIEEQSLTLRIAEYLKKLTDELGIGLVFKASYDKANRTSIGSFRGPGMDEGLEILAKIRREFDVPVVSDVHDISQISAAAEVLDILQIPAFLSRQTDLLLAAARTGKVVNVKKGQFLAPWDMANAVKKIEEAGNNQVLLTERGASFGYNNLVVDMRSLVVMRETGCPVVFDATHSVQLPGGAGTSSGGQRQYVGALSRAAVAVGIDALFWEVHENPDAALCDGPNSLPLDGLRPMLHEILAIDALVKGRA